MTTLDRQAARARCDALKEAAASAMNSDEFHEHAFEDLIAALDLLDEFNGHAFEDLTAALDLLVECERVLKMWLQRFGDEELGGEKFEKCNLATPSEIIEPELSAARALLAKLQEG